ncbi:FAD-dependent monooxygenase [Luteibacter flocculans]|uniref:FAD-dependent monooxygenase n=1 Tax=Luteibacter flocculans TaxID=2780091 RepID=A0ABY4SXA5_9GAMM|nr:FAD-dependent monooxygenase [Luteibacter flocculans]URL56900.1 FAD-dependent monooxygenase [Luteibacter flocculans]
MHTAHAHIHDVDVAIAGAGPVGLFLACELRLAGCSVIVLEREPDPHSPLKDLPLGLRGLTVPSLESLERRGLLDPLKAHVAEYTSPHTPHWMQATPRRPGGHFAGIPFFHDRIDPTAWPYRLPPLPDTFAADMASIEAIFARRSGALGVVLHRGCGVEGLESFDDGVVVRTRGESFRTRWLVGCDGARSAVRKAAGIAFTGTEPEFTGYSARVTLADAESLKPGRHYTVTGVYTYAAPGTIAMVDFDGGAAHRTGPLTREHIESVLRRIARTDVSVATLHVATTWTDRAFQASRYRQGRVLLAGDAAHIHSPLGGQGLNLGLGDAMNLGWKLAATLKGNAPSDLLDSYEHERQPVAARVLDASRAQVTLMRPDAGSRALGAILHDLMETHDGATYFAERVWGVGLRYDLGDEHPLVGCSAPPIEARDGTRLDALLRLGGGLLLDFDRRTTRRDLAQGWCDRVTYVACDAEQRWGLSAMLVRPDGIVAWARDDDADEGLEFALRRWFGNPGHAA